MSELIHPMETSKRICGRAAVLVLSLLALACAEKGPVLIGNVKYLASETTKAGNARIVVGVSSFRDLRGVSASVLGKRTIRDYVENDLVVQGTVADLATEAFKAALRSRGVAVQDAPSWDLSPETAAGTSVDLLVGGEIRTLWVDVVSQPLNVQEKAEVALRLSAVTLPERTVVKTLVMNSKTEKQELAFSYDAVEGLLSEALSSAIDQFLKDNDVKKRIE